MKRTQNKKNKKTAMAKIEIVAKLLPGIGATLAGLAELLKVIFTIL